MKKIVVLLLPLLLAGFTSARAEQLLVFAAVSLSDALAEISSSYTAESGDELQFNLQASSALVRQIAAGAPADVFISADEEKMDQLQAQQLIDERSRIKLLGNALVLVAAPDNTAIRAATDLTSAVVEHIAIAQPDSVPAGIYARKYLQHIGLWDALQPKFIPTENVRAALSAVMSGNAAAGFVYKTDATSTPRVKIAYEIPEEDVPPIIYPAAVVKDAPHNEAAQRFLSYLTTDAAGVVFEKHGFKRIATSEP